MPRSVLHYADVLRWADEHRQRTGEFPNVKSGVVVAKPDEKWPNIDQVLRIGFRGFPGHSTLAQLLAKRRGHRNRGRLPRYTIAGILRWADAHHGRTSRWPTEKSGPIEQAPGETWMAVDMALRQGNRGLPGGNSLPRLLAQRRRVRNRIVTCKPLSIKQVLLWADAYKDRTGFWPQIKSGPIQESPTDTWCAIDHGLREGTRGLPGGSSLAQLLAERRNVRPHIRRAPLSVAQILEWADSTSGARAAGRT